MKLLATTEHETQVSTQRGRLLPTSLHRNRGIDREEGLQPRATRLARAPKHQGSSLEATRENRSSTQTQRRSWKTTCQTQRELMSDPHLLASPRWNSACVLWKTYSSLLVLHWRQSWEVQRTWDMGVGYGLSECAVHVHRQVVNLAQFQQCEPQLSCSVEPGNTTPAAGTPRAPAAGPTTHACAARMLPATHVRAQGARRTT